MEEINRKCKILFIKISQQDFLDFIMNNQSPGALLLPREHFLKLENLRVHKRIDDKSVWSIPCFFIDKHFRRQGISVQLLKAVIRYAEGHKIKIIEAYPTIPTQENIPDTFAWIGLYKAFKRAGFEIVDTTSKSRPMVRYYLNNH